MNFLDGTTVIGTAEPLTAGVATFSDSSLTVGTHSITAVYSGDTNFTTSTSTPALSQVVDLAPAITSAAARSFAIGSANTFTVTTTGTPTAALSETGALPTGVTFVNNGDGTATLASTAATPAGTYHVDDHRRQRRDPRRHPDLHADRRRPSPRRSPARPPGRSPPAAPARSR